ncbi:putative metal-dependent hydrolase [Hoeflea sp. IMCC20628]|uniref:cyclase family protein n=1 Tax=Hoeflea sp. IMCC20628 TaxID=1620421 RepID=UPI00063AFE7B|nr:cyclase family protein [Hoeflea sp. IMCC20628]AKI01940.1 putative metal-dependent hydrolase [Hoeflea sp. IMCC20628]
MSDVTIIDLSVAISPENWEPEPIVIDWIDHVAGADKLGKSAYYFQQNKGWRGLLDGLFCRRQQPIDHCDFPDGMGLSQMFYRLSTHTGTHIDAPIHYGWRKDAGTLPCTISEIPLEWCYGAGILLDSSTDRGEIDAENVARQCKSAGLTVSAGDIVLINTGANRLFSRREYFIDYRPIGPSAVSYLLDRGVKVIGTDAFSFDAPFMEMIEAYRNTGDTSTLWPAHMMGRDRPYLQIERLGNLDRLPRANGFTVSCLPIKLEHADAAWSRVVAIFEGKIQ